MPFSDENAHATLVCMVCSGHSPMSNAQALIPYGQFTKINTRGKVSNFALRWIPYYFLRTNLFMDMTSREPYAACDFKLTENASECTYGILRNKVNKRTHI